MSQDLAGELRKLARRLSGNSDASRADMTRDFWNLAGQLRAALPPLLLPHRSAPGKRRIGYLAATPERTKAHLASLSREHIAGAEDVWWYRIGPASDLLPVTWARTVDLTRLGELQAARTIAEVDLDVLIDPDGSALTAVPLIIALRPARAIIEPLFEPAWPGEDAIATGAPDRTRDIAYLAHLGRSAVNHSRSALLPLTDSAADLNSRVNHALGLHQSGDLDAARAAYENILARYAEHPVAAYLLGQLLYQQGRTTEAIPWLQHAVRAAPEFRDAHYTLGQRLADAGRWGEAAIAYRSAVELTPDFAPGWSGLGLALIRDVDGDGRAAIEHFERAIALEPETLQWQFNLGVALQHRGQPAAARHVYEQVLARDPAHVEARFNQGTIAQDHGDYPAAIAAYRAILRQQSGFAAAYAQLGACLQLTGQIAAWLDNFRDFCGSCAKSLTMAVYGLEASMAAGDPAAHAGWRDRILAGEFPAADPEEFTRNWEQLLFLLLHVDLDRKVLRECYERYDAMATTWYGAPHALPRDRRSGARRIGYLSGDLREHVMGHMIYEWVSRHDRGRYDIKLYSLSTVRDAWTARFEALGVPIVDLSSLPHSAAASRIEQDDIDLLIDCSGHTRGAQPGILARKPARVIATHIATPGPVGLRSIDYKLTETRAESDDAQEFVIERLMPVPGGVFPWRRYSAPPAIQQTLPGRSAGVFVCGVFVSLMKLSPRCLSLWRRILDRVPNAVLAFSPAQASWHPAYLRWLHAHGIDRDRVIFIPRPDDEAGQLARYRMLDAALDPLPCGNVNGTMEALAMGVPVVTLVGSRHGERLGNALLTRFGVTETIARDEEEYIGIVARLAGDAQWASRLRGLIAQRLVDSPVWNADAHVRGLESTYDQMLEERGVVAVIR